MTEYNKQRDFDHYNGREDLTQINKITRNQSNIHIRDVSNEASLVPIKADASNLFDFSRTYKNKSFRGARVLGKSNKEPKFTRVRDLC